MADEWVDFAVAAYREEGVWQVEELAHEHVEDIEDLAHALRRFPGDGGVLGMIGIEETYAVLVRVTGSRIQILLSDIEAAEEFELAESILEHLTIPPPEDEDEPAVVGDLSILADAGISAIDMSMRFADYDAYPDELLSEIAHQLGFGTLFDNQVGLGG